MNHLQVFGQTRPNSKVIHFTTLVAKLSAEKIVER